MMKWTRDHQLATLSGWAVLTTLGCVAAYAAGRAHPGVWVPKPSVAASASAAIAASAPRHAPAPSPSAARRTALVLPASPDDVPPWNDWIGVKRDPDMEVCRSINTSCGGFYDQDRCRKGPKSWTAILTPGQVNCVVAAQGLVDEVERAYWIQSCAPEINCRVPH
jgi:hypothetical protein